MKKDKKKSGIIKEFSDFIARGNVIDLAVGVIIGGAFQKIVSSLVDDIFMPIVSILTGGIDFSNWFVVLSFKEYDKEAINTLAKAKEAGLATLNFGTFISAVINFFIMAVVIFLIVKAINKVNDVKNLIHKEEEEEAAPTTKICPFCKTEIDIEAVKCPNCTSDLPEEENE